MGYERGEKNRIWENYKFPKYSDVNKIMTKDEYLIYKEMKIDPVQIFKFVNSNILQNLLHAAQCYGELLNLHSDDLALAIIEAGEFLELERNEALDKMETVEKIEIDENYYFEKEFIKGKKSETKNVVVGEIYKDDTGVKKAEHNGE